MSVCKAQPVLHWIDSAIQNGTHVRTDFHGIGNWKPREWEKKTSWNRYEFFFRFRLRYLYGGHHVSETAGDVDELAFGYVRVLGGCVVHAQPPGQKPNYADQPRAVEHVRPAPVFQHVPAERERDRHADRTAFWTKTIGHNYYHLSRRTVSRLAVHKTTLTQGGLVLTVTERAIWNNKYFTKNFWKNTLYKINSSLRKNVAPSLHIKTF